MQRTEDANVKEDHNEEEMVEIPIHNLPGAITQFYYTDGERENTYVMNSLRTTASFNNSGVLVFVLAAGLYLDSLQRDNNMEWAAAIALMIVSALCNLSYFLHNVFSEHESHIVTSLAPPACYEPTVDNEHSVTNIHRFYQRTCMHGQDQAAISATSVANNLVIEIAALGLTLFVEAGLKNSPSRFYAGIALFISALIINTVSVFSICKPNKKEQEGIGCFELHPTSYYRQ